MRGDLLHINNKNNPENTPKLEQIKNLISFTQAKSSSTSTRISIPYMLTPAIPDDFEQALNSKGLPTYFKYLGFETSWFGNQGIFGAFESSFAKIALETDNRAIMKDLCKYNSTSKPCDGDILPFLNNHFNVAEGNQFSIIHFMGSHWNFDDRYPSKEFEKFTPVCHEFHRTSCKKEDMINTYHNTIIYSDYVLNKIIEMLHDKNAIMIYASDHGYSLGERGILGNAFAGKINIPQEQLDIGMFFWASDKYRKNNPGVWKKVLEKKNSPVNHDYIFHSILDCANVKSDFIEPGLSLCK